MTTPSGVDMPPSIGRLLARVSPSSDALPPLQATRPFDAALTTEIEAFAAKRSSPDRPCVRAALYLLNDDIGRAHSISQDDESDMTSNLCHAILHRREGDFWNAKWWYGQIRHPLIEQIYGGTQEAQAFVDAVEGIVGGGGGGGKRGAKGASTACAAGNVDRLKRRQADELAHLVKYVMQEHVR